MEAAAVVDEQNGPLAHNGLENAARFRTAPTAQTEGPSTTETTAYNLIWSLSRPHLTCAPFWSEEWGPPHTTSNSGPGGGADLIIEGGRFVQVDRDSSDRIPLRRLSEVVAGTPAARPFRQYRDFWESPPPLEGRWLPSFILKEFREELVRRRAGGIESYRSRNERCVAVIAGVRLLRALTQRTDARSHCPISSARNDVRGWRFRRKPPGSPRVSRCRPRTLGRPPGGSVAGDHPPGPCDSIESVTPRLAEPAANRYSPRHADHDPDPPRRCRRVPPSWCATRTSCSPARA